MESAGKYAKFWIEPIALARNVGFRPFELNEIRNIIIENTRIIKESILQVYYYNMSKDNPGWGRRILVTGC